MKHGSQDQIAGLIALLKVQATRTFEFCAREASQVMGGASYIRGGVGEKVTCARGQGAGKACHTWRSFASRSLQLSAQEACDR